MKTVLVVHVYDDAIRELATHIVAEGLEDHWTLAQIDTDTIAKARDIALEAAKESEPVWVIYDMARRNDPGPHFGPMPEALKEQMMSLAEQHDPPLQWSAQNLRTKVYESRG